MEWEVTCAVFRDNGHSHYKVTKRCPELKIAETKFFKKKEDAELQFREWLE